MPLEPEDTTNDRAFTDAAAGSPPPATPVESTPAQASPPTQESISQTFAAAEKLGIDVSQYTSEEALVADLWKQQEDLRRERERLQPYVDYANQVLPFDSQVRQILQGQPAQQEPQAEPEEWSPNKHFEKAWQRPEYDKRWESFVTSGMIVVDPDTRQFVPAEGYAGQVPPQVLQGLNGRMAWQREALEKLLENPYQQTWDAFQEPIERMVSERVQQILAQTEYQRAVQGWERENAKLMYETTANGSVAYDVRGEPILTPYGEAFVTAYHRLRPTGDALRDLQDAAEMAKHYLPQQQATPPAEAQASGEPTNGNGQDKSFLGQAMEKARHRASSGAFAENDEIDPVVRGVQDLESMFTSAGRKAGVK